MIDFMEVAVNHKKDGIEVYPNFIIMKSKDLMIRGSDFYAIWDEEAQMWSTDEQDVIRIVDKELDKFVEKNRAYYDTKIKIMYMRTARSGSIDVWHKYCQKQMRDNFHMLDEKIIFSNTEVDRKDYASKRLSYPLSEGSIDAWNKLVSTLYSDEERHKIEWAIGAIVSGDSKEIQKFMVLYGAAGTGKSTILNIIQKLFEGYYSVFDAKSLGSSNNSFALEAFKGNPLVAIQHDGDLSHIEDNTRLNSLVSHELMTVNEKFKSAYANRFKAFLIMGTNKPVRITDAKSGLIRRLIDVTPTGKKLSSSEYHKLMKQIKFELGAIAYHCLQVYSEDPGYYNEYEPVSMMASTNDFYNFILDKYRIFYNDDCTTLAKAYPLYNAYCDEARVQYPMNRRTFGEELKNYFWNFEERHENPDGKRVRSYYSGFRVDKFEKSKPKPVETESQDDWLKMDAISSVLDEVCANYPAQYANDIGIPKYKWDICKTTLSELDTTKLHYLKLPLVHIFIDFDLKDENGNKSFELNRKAASEWPPTYAELSKGGEGIHLHYIYDGDPTLLDNSYSDGIEIKVNVGNSSVRRRLSKCNNLPIATISSGLPLKGAKKKKMVSDYTIHSVQDLRNRIIKQMDRSTRTHGSTKQSINLIKEILDTAYNQGITYDVSDLYGPVYSYACNSTNNSEYCREVVRELHFKSEEEVKDDSPETNEPIIFYDVEVFPNLFIICWKMQEPNLTKDGIKNFEVSHLPIARLINPTPEAVEELLKSKLVGFNNRKYDNHILWARAMGYDNQMLYNLSQRIITEHDGYFREAYNLSYTDIYDFASAGNKKSLKKLEIEMGIHHQELGLPWDKPVPEELWEKVADYCENDVLATEAAFVYLQGDYMARGILAELANGKVNDTTNQLSTKWVLEGNKDAQKQFNYRNLGEPMMSLDPETYEFLKLVKPDMMAMTHGPAGSILPYFPGYKYEYGKSTYKDVNETNPVNKVVGEGGFVYAKFGVHYNVALLDIESMHPNTIISEVLFGVYYTKRFKDILDARLYIKHKDWDAAEKVMNGQLKPYIQKVKDGIIKAKDLANALKTVINAIYGLTKATFEHPFRDPRNIDNIVAKRGALFMINLKEEVEKLNYQVVHIKTDSIKIANADQYIIHFVSQYGKKFGYNFKHEATYDRMALVTKADYIAKYATAEWCTEEYVDYIPDDNIEHGGQWTATGARYSNPYVFKNLFSCEPITVDDMCSVINVDKGALYLDANEGMPDVTAEEKALEKLKKQYKEGKVGDMTYESTAADLEKDIAKGHNYIFVGRIGQFCPMKEGSGGGLLRCLHDGKYSAAAGSKGYRWMESENVRTLGLEKYIDRSYYDELCMEACELIAKYANIDEFINGEDQPNSLPF